MTLDRIAVHSRTTGPHALAISYIHVDNDLLSTAYPTTPDTNDLADHQVSRRRELVDRYEVSEDGI
jgi:hypothetical protein